MDRTTVRGANGAAALFLAACVPAVSAQTVEERLRALEAQNESLHRQLTSQQSTIDELKQQLENRDGTVTFSTADATKSGLKIGPVHLSGEGGIGFFHTGSNGQYPSGTFRVDEAKLFLEAPLWQDTYVFGELDLVTREANDEYFHLGELYIDFENVLRRWTDRNYLSLRVGRVDIPFGEEYTVRDVIDNPLISHSLSDLWGIDEGIEVYGSGFGFDYAMAVQNGSHPTMRDFTSDKSVAGRLGYNFGKRARLSFSGMRTGDIAVADEKKSEMWFGNGFFRSVGTPASTSTFGVEIFELDAQTFWKSGHFKLAGGYFSYDDNDSSAERARDGYYYYAEGVQNLTSRFYAAGRFSQIMVDDGMPLVGHGDFGEYFYGPLTTDLWRLSIGLGYRFSENLIAKIEYTLEQGELTSGADRDHHNFFGVELGFKF